MRIGHQLHQGLGHTVPTLAPGLSSPGYDQISVVSKCLSRFGALRLGKHTSTSEPIAGCLQAPGAVERCLRGRPRPRSLPSPAASYPPPSGPRQFPKSPGGLEFISGGRM